MENENNENPIDTEEFDIQPPSNYGRQEIIVWTKRTRQNLDKVLQGMKDVQKWPKTPKNMQRNLAISITELENAIMRLGMVLKDLNTENPYPNSYNPANTIIEPTADNLKL